MKKQETPYQDRRLEVLRRNYEINLELRRKIVEIVKRSNKQEVVDFIAQVGHGSFSDHLKFLSTFTGSFKTVKTDSFPYVMRIFIGVDHNEHEREHVPLAIDAVTTDRTGAVIVEFCKKDDIYNPISKEGLLLHPDGAMHQILYDDPVIPTVVYKLDDLKTLGSYRVFLELSASDGKKTELPL
jgi:hypothetical protein